MPKSTPPPAELRALAPFLFGLAASRMRARARWAGAVIALSLVIPYEVVDDRPQFMWQVLRELPPAGLVAAFASAAAGAAIVLASWLCRRASTIAVVSLAALAGAWIVIELGAESAAWGLLPVPESLTQRPAPILLALAMTAAGADLSFKEHARKVSRVLLLGAVAIAAAFYLWPAQGEAPASTLLRSITGVRALPSPRLKLGFLIVTLMVAWPGIMSVLALVHLRIPARREQPVTGVVAVFGLPAMLLMLVYRSMLGFQGGAWIITSAGSVVLLAALIALLASSFEILAERLLAGPVDLDEPAGWALQRAALAAGAAVLVAGLGQWLLARPPSKGVHWDLNPASPQADRLFGTLVHDWSTSRARRDSGDGSSEEARSRAAAGQMVEAARALDPGLGEAFGQLASEADALDVAGRRWYRLVADVNEASRRAGLPYYVEPRVALHHGGEGLSRSFDAAAFRIERVRSYEVAGRPFATLHVRQIGERRAGLPYMGLSRDVEPFALVALDELEPYEKGWSEVARLEPPRCGDAQEPGAEAGLRRCGETVKQLIEASPGGLRDAILAATERHELQHQIDGPNLAMAGVVLRRMGAYGKEAQKKVNRELSGYLAELTCPAGSPKLALAHLLRFSLLSRGGAEHFVGFHVLESMTARELYGADGRAEAGEVSEAFVELTSLPDEELRARAARAWRRNFGAQLPSVAER